MTVLLVVLADLLLTFYAAILPANCEIAVQLTEWKAYPNDFRAVASNVTSLTCGTGVCLRDESLEEQIFRLPFVVHVSCEVK